MITIYSNNEDLIDRDNQLVIREWDQGVFFNSGMFTGQIQKVYLDNAPKQRD